jgi:hypothetical protein
MSAITVKLSGYSRKGPKDMRMNNGKEVKI